MHCHPLSNALQLLNHSGFWKPDLHPGKPVGECCADNSQAQQQQDALASNGQQVLEELVERIPRLALLTLGLLEVAFGFIRQPALPNSSSYPISLIASS